MRPVTDFKRDQEIEARIFFSLACLALVIAVASVVFGW